MAGYRNNNMRGSLRIFEREIHMTTLTNFLRVAAAVSAVAISGSALAQDADTVRGNCINEAMAAYPDPGIYEHQRQRTQLYINCMRSNGLTP